MAECSPRCSETHTFASGCAMAPDVMQDRQGPNLFLGLVLLVIITLFAGLIYASVRGLQALQDELGPTPTCSTSSS